MVLLNLWSVGHFFNGSLLEDGLSYHGVISYSLNWLGDARVGITVRVR